MSDGSGMFDELGRVLGALRRERGLSQQELAERAGISPSMVSGYESGKHHPKLPTLGKVLNALGVDAQELGWRLRSGRGPRRFEIEQAGGYLPGSTALEISEVLENLGVMTRLAIRHPAPAKRTLRTAPPPGEAEGNDGDR